jgi:hypothetical protein
MCQVILVEGQHILHPDMETEIRELADPDGNSNEVRFPLFTTPAPGLAQTPARTHKFALT